MATVSDTEVDLHLFFSYYISAFFFFLKCTQTATRDCYQHFFLTICQENKVIIGQKAGVYKSVSKKQH